MENFLETFKPFIFIVLGIAALVFTIGFISYKYDVNVANSNLIQVKDGDKIIYEGKSAFVGVSSGGMTTTVTIYKKLFPFSVTDRDYSSQNIKISPILSNP